MAISFLGHSPSFAVWAFNVNGRRVLARNYSTPSPLSIRFAGAFDESPVAGGLIKTSGFDITESTDKNVIWSWAGKRYTSNWEINDDDPENVTIQFGTPIPYSGPPVAPVGTTLVKTKDEREAAEAASTAAGTQITPAAQLSAQAPVQQSPAPAPAAETPKTTTVSPTGPNVQFSNKTKEDIEASTAYKSPDTTNRTPVPSPAPYTPPPQAQVPVGITTSPVIIPGTKDAREAAAEAAAAAAAKPDWVKLALQLGAAYLLLS